jgi:hypothetical protein
MTKEYETLITGLLFISQYYLYVITLLYFVCPDLLNPVGEPSYGIQGVVHRITQFPLFVF